MRASRKYKLEVFETEKLLNEATAKFIIDLAHKAVAGRNKFTIALSGGQTPIKLYKLLARTPYSKQLPWKKTHVFWGDERCVPLNDKRNNANQAKLALLNKVDIPLQNIHIIPVNQSPEVAARKYEIEIMTFFKSKKPSFDLILLGLGENGHTASLFPNTSVIKDKTKGIREIYVKEENEYRITMTAPLINQARNTLFLVVGKNKATILREVLTRAYTPNKYPAQLINSAGLIWLADKKAASLVQTTGKTKT